MRFLRQFRLAVLFLGLGTVAACGLFGYPKVSPAPAVKVAGTPDQIERGRYLANHVAACIDCHSVREWDLLGAPPRPGTTGMGGEHFGPHMGFPGDFYSANITPFGIGNWSDGEIIRAFTAGVTKDGRSLFPVMPYPAYGKMAAEDAQAIVAYLRTLESIETQIPKSKAIFPVSLILPTIPRDPVPAAKRPDPSDPSYGEYVTTMAACIDCHSQAKKGEKLPGLEYAGGFEFRMPGGTIRSANITPDVETGIGAWSRETFIAKFKDRDPVKNPPKKLEPGDLNSPMPWTMYAGMTEEDLGAIYGYLKTLKPVKNLVQQTDAPK